MWLRYLLIFVSTEVMKCNALDVRVQQQMQYKQKAPFIIVHSAESYNTTLRVWRLGFEQCSERRSQLFLAGVRLKHTSATTVLYVEVLQSTVCLMNTPV